MKKFFKEKFGMVKEMYSEVWDMVNWFGKILLGIWLVCIFPVVFIIMCGLKEW